MDFTVYIKPEFLVIIPVLYIIGIILKNIQTIKDSFIPLILCVISIVLSLVYVLSVSSIADFSSAMSAVFTALTQGFLVTGAAVLCNQIKKQNDKNDKDDKNSGSS